MSVILIKQYRAQCAYQGSFKRLQTSVNTLQANVDHLTELLTKMPESPRKNVIEQQVGRLADFLNRAVDEAYATIETKVATTIGAHF